MAEQQELSWLRLRILEEEVEEYAGLELSDLYMGGIWLGIVRRNRVRSQRGKLLLLGTELMVVALTMMFAMPVGLMMTRSSAPLPPQVQLQRFLGGVITTTSLALGARGWWRLRQQKALSRLQAMVTDVEQFNQVVETLSTLQNLQDLGKDMTPAPITVNPMDYQSLLDSLRMTRKHLTLGLQVDYQLRHQQQLSYPDLLTDVAVQISQLQVMSHTVPNEYSQVLNQLMQISHRVQEELQPKG